MSHDNVVRARADPGIQLRRGDGEPITGVWAEPLVRGQRAKRRNPLKLKEIHFFDGRVKDFS